VVRPPTVAIMSDPPGEVVVSPPPAVLQTLLPVRAVADVLGVSTRTVFRLAGLAPGHPDRLPAVRIGARVVFRPDDIREFVEAHRG
jgi:hypothetical protein